MNRATLNARAINAVVDNTPAPSTEVSTKRRWWNFFRRRR